MEVTVTSPANVVTTLTLSPDGTTKDYTVTGTLNTSGGSITLLNNGQAWLTAGMLSQFWSITIARVVPLTQLTNVRGEGRYNPEIHENEYDLIVMALQQQDAEITDLAALQFSGANPQPLGTATPGISNLASRGDHVHPAVINATTGDYGLAKLAANGDTSAGVVVQGNDSRLVSTGGAKYAFCFTDILATTTTFPKIPGQGQNVSKVAVDIGTASTGADIILSIRTYTRSTGAALAIIATVTLAAGTFTKDITFTSTNIPTTQGLTQVVTQVGSVVAGANITTVVS